MRHLVTATILVLLAQRAAAQDTLSDSAWKADVARRAAARHRAEAQRDSATLLVDSIYVTPSELTLHVGDTLTFPQLVAQLKAVGKKRDGSVVTGFRTSYMLSPRSKAVVVRNGQVVAESVGEGELWAKAGAPSSPFDDSHPTTKIRLIVR